MEALERQQLFAGNLGRCVFVCWTGLIIEIENGPINTFSGCYSSGSSVFKALTHYSPNLQQCEDIFTQGFWKFSLFTIVPFYRFDENNQLCCDWFFFLRFWTFFRFWFFFHFWGFFFVLDFFPISEVFFRFRFFSIFEVFLRFRFFFSFLMFSFTFCMSIFTLIWRKNIIFSQLKSS